MYSKYLLLAIFSAFIVGCSSSYKTTQTPDDVYFSTEKPSTDNYVQVRKNNNRYYTADEYYEDRMLKMMVRDRNRWSEVDDWYYYNNRYSNYNNRYSNYSYSMNWNNPWNSYSSWNYNFNPYCPSNNQLRFINTGSLNTGSLISSKTINSPRVYNLIGYSNELDIQKSNNKIPGINTNNWFYTSNTNNNSNQYPSSYNQKSSNRSDGGLLRDVFNSMGNSSRSNNSYQPNSNSTNNNSSGSSGSSSGTTAPVRKFDN